MASQQQQLLQTIPLKVLVDKQSNKVAFVEATKHFVDTLFSFLSLPLGTIVRLLATTNNNNDQQQLPESSPFLENIKNLYQSVQNRNSDIPWNNPFCEHMLLYPRNPCVNCTCGKPTIRQPTILDSDEGQVNYAQDGVFVRETTPWFLVSDDLKKIVPCSRFSSLEMLTALGYSDLTHLEEVTHNINKQEVSVIGSPILYPHTKANSVGCYKRRDRCVIKSPTLDVRWPEHEFTSRDNLHHTCRFCRNSLGRIILAKAKNRLDMPRILWKERDGGLSWAQLPILRLIKRRNMLG
ncbi:hypothetical protein L195_g042256 [Trifolium pratense]|uniref:DUF674 family protein n=1 Tax=Trifolium pratense TaxID=57577 RepID=A0A2K3M5X9_TRIPR|nr:hypothetical protein L195_g042256 [Trifolium pratense]